MKKRVWMALCLQACLLAACSSEMTDPPVGADNGWLEVNFTNPETRTSLDDSGAGSFSDGDKVGLYIDNGSNVAYRELTYSGGHWLPLLQRSDFGDGELTLAAHYPVQKGADEVDKAREFNFTLSQDQNNGGFAASDLLFGRKTVPADTNRAEISFAHALHRLRIEFSGDVKPLGAELRSRMSGRVNLLTGTVTTDGQFGWISPEKLADGSFEAVILPQAADDYRTAEGLLKIATSEREVIYQAPQQIDGKPLTEFAAGKQLTIKLTLKKQEETDPPVISDWANKKMWVHGITAPVWEEGSTVWKQSCLPFYACYYLAWKAEYGWFDCNKTAPTNTNIYAEADGNMCWAASVSNLLHWWFTQNKSYIDRYGERYQGPDYNFPLPKKQESDIFQCFIDAFINEGGFGEQGINWFINGDIPSGPARRPPYNDAGYFKEVFGNARLGKDHTGMGKTRFNETIKDALANRKAIAVSTGTAQSGHLETIWGAEFDENGDVAYIYVADNNDRDLYESDGIGVGRFPIVYSSGNTSTGFLTGYVGEDGQIVTSKAINIKRLTTIELGQEYWEAYFKQHPEP